MERPHVREQLVRVDGRIVLGNETERGQLRAYPGAVAIERVADGGPLPFDSVGRDPLRHAEVDERHPTVVEQQVVPRMWVAGEVTVAVKRAEEKSEHDLREAVLRRAIGLL